MRTSSDKKLSILGHLRELRNRLLKSVLAIAVTTIICFIFADYIFHILTVPAAGIELVYIEMTEMISTYMKVCLISGIIIAMPYLTYQVVMFVFPALTRKERKYILLVLPWIALMFAGGVVFGYFILIPPAIKFLISFGSNIASPEIKIGNYISIISRLLLAIGLVFEMPVITTFLSRLGVITPRWLSSKRKGAVIFAFVVAAIITPTIDPVNQCLVAAPLIVLYELSIWLAKLFHRKESRAATPVPSPVSQD